MNPVSYYYAVILGKGKWYAYIPDFNVFLSIPGDIESGRTNLPSVVYKYIYGMLDRYYNADAYDDEDKILQLPKASAIYYIISSTKYYLRMHGIPIDCYIENKEVIVEYDKSKQSTANKSDGN